MTKKVHLDTKILKENLDIAIRWVQTKTISDALQCFLLRHDGEILSVYATDGLSTDIALSIDAPGSDPFEMCINAARLTEKISAYDKISDGVTLKFGKRVIIESDNGKDISSIATSDCDGFPTLFDYSGDKYITIDPDEFATAIARAKGAVDLKSPFPALSGIYFAENGDVVSIDGYRVSLYKWKPIADRSLLVNGNTCYNISLAISGKEEIKSFATDDRLVIIWDGGSISTTLMQDIKFPNYNDIIPQKVETTVVVDGPALKSKILLAKVDALESQNLVTLETHEDALLVRSKSPIGMHQSELKYLSLNGPAKSVGLSIKYLVDAMNKLGHGDISIGINTEKSLVVFSPLDDDYIYGIMPMAVTQ